MSDKVGCTLCKAWIDLTHDDYGKEEDKDKYFCAKCCEDMPDYAGWGVFQDYPDQWHIRPINESEHLHDTCCQCNPRVEQENGIDLVVHSSFDGREGLEQAMALLKSEKL